MRLRAIRKAAGFTQTRLAELIGVHHKGTVSGIELGHRDTGIPMLEKWVAACGARIDIVLPDQKTADLSELPTEEDVRLVLDLIALMPRLDIVLKMTLRQQLTVWAMMADPE